MNLGHSIKFFRQQLGYTQIQFAEKIGVTQTYLSQIENNKKNPQTSVTIKIAESLDMPMPVLMWKTLQAEDIQEEKRAAFMLIKPHVDALIASVFNSEIKTNQ